MFQGKYEYKNALKAKEKDRQEYFSDELNDALICKDLNSFWKTWHSTFSKTKASSVIDGVCDASRLLRISLMFLKTRVYLTLLINIVLLKTCSIITGLITGVICRKIFMLM